MIHLEPITPENLDDVLQLSVSADQQAFVSTVTHSLAQAWAYRDAAFPFAIYAGDVPVGFVMLGYYEARKQYTLWKFLIDRRHQGKGYGRAALGLAVEHLHGAHHAREIYTGVSLGNTVAKRLYLSFGFTETGLIQDGMEELKYVFP